MSRNWIGTINNPKQKLGWYLAQCSYKVLSYCGQEEKGEKKGTRHIQLFIQFDRVRKMEQMQKWVPKAHWEIAVNPEKAWEYCCKEDTRIEGTTEKSHEQCPAGMGRRNDITEMRELAIREGIDAVVQELPDHYIRYHRGLEALIRRRIPKRTWKTEVHVRWGEPGIGKTRYVYENFDNVCSIEPDEKWFDGYEGDEIVLFDEFRGQIPLRRMLLICDRYPLRVQVKGGSVQWAPKQIWITSDIPPEMWYNYNGTEYEQLQRRLTTVTEVRSEVAG